MFEIEMNSRLDYYSSLKEKEKMETKPLGMLALICHLFTFKIEMMTFTP